MRRLHTGGSELLSGMSRQRSFRPFKLRSLPGWLSRRGTSWNTSDERRSPEIATCFSLAWARQQRHPSVAFPYPYTHTFLPSSMPGQGALAALLSDRRRRVCSAEPFSVTVRLVCGLVDGLKTCPLIL